MRMDPFMGISHEIFSFYQEHVNAKSCEPVASVLCCKLSQNQFDLVAGSQLGCRNVIPFHCSAIQSQRRNTALYMVRILHRNLQLLAAEHLLHGKAIPIRWNCRMNMQSISGRIPQIPSTQPTITVEAVPVSQCTWERPAYGEAVASVNCPCT